MDHLLSDVIGRLGQLEGTLRTFMKQWGDQDTSATLGRRVIHEKLELLTLQVNRLSTDIEGVQQDIAELKNEVDSTVMPTVQMFKLEQDRKLHRRGGLALFIAGIAAAISFLAYVTDKLVTLIMHRP